MRGSLTCARSESFAPQLLHTPLSLRSAAGQGTTFAVELPLLRRDRVNEAGAAPDRRGVAGTRVLVVDNDPLALTALASLLQRWGCEVDTASDGDGARACLQRADADLWLFDYHLDHGDTGVALAERLGDAFGPRPTLILSADAGAAVRRAVHEAGLSLIGKPLKPLALKSVLDRLLASRTLG